MNGFLDWKWIAAIVGLGVLLAMLQGLIGRPAGQRYPYFSRQTLMTAAELKFYQVLRQVVPSDIAIFGKVRLSDLIDCAKEDRRQGYFAKISQKHVDFVLVSIATTAILCAIELDDSSHQLAHRQRRDEFVDGAFAAAEIPLIRVPCAKEYSAGAIASELKGRILKAA